METGSSSTEATQTNAPRRADLKQMGLGGGIVAALMVLTPIKNWFYTREEGTALSQAVMEVKTLIVSESRETTRVMERKTDKILERLKESEDRTQRNADRDNDIQNERIKILEATVLKAPHRLTN